MKKKREKGVKRNKKGINFAVFKNQIIVFQHKVNITRSTLAYVVMACATSLFERMNKGEKTAFLYF